MGLFDNLLNRVPVVKKYTPEDIREAYASVLYCCANAEGNIGEDELTSIYSLFMTIRVFDDCDGAEYLQVAEKMYNNFSSAEIIEGSFLYIKESLRAQLFCYCCDIFLSDGVVTEEEKQILEQISHISGIEEDIAKKILEVALIRNVSE